jgi:hypothetical protein
MQATVTERTRILTQNILWKEQLATRRTKAIAEVERCKELKEQKIRQEEERQKAQLEAMEAEFDYYIEQHQAALTKCDVDEEEHKRVVETDLKKVNEILKENFPEADGAATEAAPAAATAPPKPQVATLTADMLTPAVVANHMASDASLTGMSEEQARVLMTSMFTLFQNLSQPQQPHQQPQAAAGSKDNVQQQTPQPQPPQQQQQQQGAKGGAEAETEVSSDEEESGDEAKMILVQSKNKARIARREKAAAVKGGGKGAVNTSVKK